MEILLILFFSIGLLIWWGYSGYLLLLAIYDRYSRILPIKPSDISDKDLPDVTLIIPCFNEEVRISSKIDNLLSLEYPLEKLRIIIVDGDSTDSTKKVVSERISECNIEFIVSKKAGKIHQINEILKDLDGEFVIVSDVDAKLTKDCIRQIMRVFSEKRDVGVVGAYVNPGKCMPEEIMYWDIHNKIRVLESLYYSSSIVIAGCYGFRKSVISHFPDDVIADDIYVSFKAASMGYKVVYTKTAKAVELRSSTDFHEMIAHKLRKSNAYLIEIFRFLFIVMRSDFRWKLIFYTKFLQLVLMPFIILLYGGISMIFILQGNLISSAIYSFFIAISMVISNKLLDGRSEEDVQVNRLNIIKLFMVINFIQIISIIRHPFYKQSSSYEKIGI